MLAWIGDTLMDDLAPIEPVAEEVIERAPVEGAVTLNAPRGQDPLLAANAKTLQLVAELMNRAGRQIARVYKSDRCRFGLFDDELAPLDVVSQGNGPAHPHPLAARCSQFVPDPLAGDLPFKLSEGQKDVERQPPHRGRGIELLGDRYERDPMRLEQLNQFGEIGQRSGEAVDLVDHDDVDLSVLNVGEQHLQGGAFHRSPGYAAIVVTCLDEPPLLMGLAFDV